jgi:hypothetical protein
MALTETEKTVEKRFPYKPAQFKPGNSGRPKGCRNKLGEAFVADLHEHWQKNGVAALDNCLEESAAAYCRVVAMVIPKELTIKTDNFDGITDEQLAIILAAARSALGVIDVSGEDITDAAGGKQVKTIQALPEAK